MNITMTKMTTIIIITINKYNKIQKKKNIIEITIIETMEDNKLNFRFTKTNFKNTIMFQIDNKTIIQNKITIIIMIK